LSFSPQPTRQDMIEAIKACLSLARTLTHLNQHIPALKALLHGLEHGDRFVGGQRD